MRKLRLDPYFNLSVRSIKKYPLDKAKKYLAINKFLGKMNSLLTPGALPI